MCPKTCRALFLLKYVEVSQGFRPKRADFMWNCQTKQVGSTEAVKTNKQCKRHNGYTPYTKSTIQMKRTSVTKYRSQLCIKIIVQWVDGLRVWSFLVKSFSFLKTQPTLLLDLGDYLPQTVTRKVIAKVYCGPSRLVLKHWGLNKFRCQGVVFL